MTTDNGLGTWNADSAANVYYARFSAFMDTTNKRTSKWVKVETGGSAGKFLYHYRSLAVDGGVNNQWKGIRNGSIEGFWVDFANNRIYVRVPWQR